MPSIDFVNSDNISHPDVTAHVWALMLAPDNERWRREYWTLQQILHVGRQKNLEGFSDKMVMELLFTAAAAPSGQSISNDAKMRKEKAVAAAAVLLWPCIYRNGNANAKNKVQIKLVKSVAARTQVVQRATFDANWLRYKSVSHLWCAAQIEAVANQRKIPFSFDQETGVRFLILASIFEKFAVSFRPPGSKSKALVPRGTIWTIPSGQNLDHRAADEVIRKFCETVGTSGQAAP